MIAWVACLSISSLPVRRIKSDFNNSIVYKSFRVLPRGLGLKSMLRNRERIRKVFEKKQPPKHEQLHEKFDRLKAVADSGKRTRKPDH